MASGRDTNATWRRPATLCRELDWSKRRLLHELASGQVPFRTIPPGREHAIDWCDPDVQNGFDLETGEATFRDAALAEAQSFTGRNLIIVGDGEVVVGIEVMPPAAAEVPASSADASAASPPPPPPSPVVASSSPSPKKQKKRKKLQKQQKQQRKQKKKNVSETGLRKCILTIKTERPNDPPDEDELWKEVERRLDATVSRDRVRQARDNVAPEYKLPPGRPRKSAQ